MAREARAPFLHVLRVSSASSALKP
jgi:hypothetical protein